MMGLFRKKSRLLQSESQALDPNPPRSPAPVTFPVVVAPQPTQACKCTDPECHGRAISQSSTSSTSFSSEASARTSISTRSHKSVLSTSSYKSAKSARSVASTSTAETDIPPLPPTNSKFLPASPPLSGHHHHHQPNEAPFTHERQMEIVDKIYWDDIEKAKSGPSSCWTREPPARHQKSQEANNANANNADADADAEVLRVAALLQRDLDDLVPAAERLVIEAARPAVAYIARASRLIKEARFLQSRMSRPDEMEKAIWDMEEGLLRVSGVCGLLVAARGKMEWPESRRYPGKWTEKESGGHDITASLVVDDSQVFPYGFNIKSEGPNLYVDSGRQDVTCVINGF